MNDLAPKSERDQLIAKCNALEIDTVEDIAEAKALMVTLAVGIKNALEDPDLAGARRASIDTQKFVKRLEDRAVKPYQTAKEALGQRIGAAEARIREEAAEAVSEAMDRGDFDNLPEMPVTPNGGVRTSEVWTFELVDDAAFFAWCLADTARFAVYWTPNAKTLDLVAKGEKEAFNIPGCKAVKSYSSTTRTGPAKPWGHGIKSAESV